MRNQEEAIPQDLLRRTLITLCALLWLTPAAAPFADPTPGGQTQAPGGITSEMLLSAENRLDLWVQNNRTYTAARYSPDTQINRQNVGQLELLWKYPIRPNPFGFETSAIVFDDKMFITTSGSELVRLDPHTGEPIWVWKKGSKRSQNRGPAVLGNKIYMGTSDAHLVCLDADTGLLLWERTVADNRAGGSITGAPLIVEDKVIVGVAGAEFGVRGFIDAYDAQTGKRIWRFWTVPQAGQPGSETWSGDSAVHGGGTAWLTGTYDPALRLLYWATGNPSPDYDGEARKGDNLFTNSIVALNPDNGKLVWYFQNTPHDLFDWSGVSEPILIDPVIDGQPTQAIVQANRNGYVYLLDRTDGRFISATPYTRVDWANRDPSGKPVIKPELAQAKVRHVFPGTVGGTNWPPKAFSPRTKMLYIPVIERGATYTPEPAQYRRGQLYMGGYAEYDPEPATGSITAMKVPSGEIAWKFDTHGPNWGGLLATGGGLVFGGSFDGQLNALNDETGEVLWTFQTGTGVYAPPTTFRIGGRQVIGLASGFGLMGNDSSGLPPRPKQGIYYLFGLPTE